MSKKGYPLYLMREGEEIFCTAQRTPSGKYTATVRAGYLNGEAKRFHRTAATLEKLQEVLQADLDEFEILSGGGDILTVKNAFYRYVKENELRLGDNTVKSWEKTIRTHFLSLHQIPLTRLTKENFIAAVNEEYAKGIEKKPKGYTYSTMKKFFIQLFAVWTAYAEPRGAEKIKKAVFKYMRDVTKFNPGGERYKDVDLPTVTKTVSFFAQNKKKTAERTAICALLGLHSLRSGEVLALKFSDLSIEDGVCYMQIQSGGKNKGGRNAHTKTKGSRRKLAIDARLYEMMQRRPHDSDDDFIIGLERQQYANCINAVFKANGHDKLTPHALRHIYATYHMTTDKAALAKVCGGWELNGDTAEKFYTNFSPLQKRSFMLTYSKMLLDEYEQEARKCDDFKEQKAV